MKKVSKEPETNLLPALLWGRGCVSPSPVSLREDYVPFWAFKQITDITGQQEKKCKKLVKSQGGLAVSSSMG